MPSTQDQTSARIGHHFMRLRPAGPAQLQPTLSNSSSSPNLRFTRLLRHRRLAPRHRREHPYAAAPLVAECSLPWSAPSSAAPPLMAKCSPPWSALFFASDCSRGGTRCSTTSATSFSTCFWISREGQPWFCSSARQAVQMFRHNNVNSRAETLEQSC